MQLTSTIDEAEYIYLSRILDPIKIFSYLALAFFFPKTKQKITFLIINKIKIYFYFLSLELFENPKKL